MNSVQALILQAEREVAVIDAISNVILSLSLLQATGIGFDFREDIDRLTGALALLTYPYRE